MLNNRASILQKSFNGKRLNCFYCERIRNMYVIFYFFIFVILSSSLSGRQTLYLFILKSYKMFKLCGLLQIQSGMEFFTQKNTFSLFYIEFAKRNICSQMRKLLLYQTIFTHVYLLFNCTSYGNV